MNNNLYKEISGKVYKLGYTTGTCAAAATKAAIMLLENKLENDIVIINTPYGIDLNINIVYKEKGANYAICSIKKDSGDDYDVTNGIEIFSRVEYIEDKTIITGGIGIGKVTKKGLKCKLGEYAINPEPIKMIKNAILQVSNKNFKVEIYAPEGIEMSKKTFNSRLGIVDGISIIGTTGIITPMSEEAWKESCSYELSVKKAEKKEHICFVFGNSSEVFAEKYLNINKDSIVSISNFVGYMIDTAVNMNFKSILIVGHTGKLIKLAGGIFHTHSKIADCRMEIICTILAINGIEKKIIKQIYNCNTTDMVNDILKENNIFDLWNIASDIAEERCFQRALRTINIGCIMFNNNNDIAGKSKSVDKIIGYLR